MFSSSDQKSRQSSGGKGFFSRRKDKESRVYDEDSLDPRTPSGANSANGSYSSRHSRRTSEPFNEDRGIDANGLAMAGGVITSIPYDSLSSTSRTPIPVDYLPRHDQAQQQHQSVRREPQPHHLNKTGVDYHQYPAWDGSKMPNGPVGPRQLPPTPSATSFRDRQSKASNQQSTNSYATNESSNARTSFDQASIYSTVSSHTGRSSIFSSDNTPRPPVPPHVQDNVLRPSSSHSSTRQSNASIWQNHVPSYHSATSFTPEGFNLPRPANDEIIEEQFVALMHKRGWNNLPDQARRQMLAYPAGKKWTLIHQDRLTEWQGEQKRRNNARQTYGSMDGNTGILAKADEEGSPEWYVKRILDDSITAKQLQSLSVSLRTQPIK